MESTTHTETAATVHTANERLKQYVAVVPFVAVIGIHAVLRHVLRHDPTHPPTVRQ